MRTRGMALRAVAVLALVPAGLAMGMAPAVAAPPQNLTPPSVTGTPAPGETLSCLPGTWRDAATFAYRWNRDGTAIPSETEQTYVVDAVDVSHTLSCTVTATNADGTMSASATSEPVTVPTPTGPLPGDCANAAVGTSEDDDLLGTTYGDVLYGLGGADTLVGLAGVDCLVGGPGQDTLSGGPGADRLEGGKGGDHLDGGQGRDRLRGSAGADTLIGGLGRDRLVGGPGMDLVKARDGRPDVVRCGSGQDVAVVDPEDDVTGCEVVREGRGQR